MPHCKNTNFFSEIDVFFQNSDDSAIRAMSNALKALKMTDKRLGLETFHNASVSSSEKLKGLVLLPFLGCRDISHLPFSGMPESFGYNMFYRMMRLDTKTTICVILTHKKTQPVFVLKYFFHPIFLDCTQKTSYSECFFHCTSVYHNVSRLRSCLIANGFSFSRNKNTISLHRLSKGNGAWKQKGSGRSRGEKNETAPAVSQQDARDLATPPQQLQSCSRLTPETAKPRFLRKLQVNKFLQTPKFFKPWEKSSKASSEVSPAKSDPSSAPLGKVRLS